jgi:hypothetical protein
MAQPLGRWEITLRPSVGPKKLITTGSQSTHLFLEAIGSMYATYLPCRSLGIYHFDHSMHSLPGVHVLLKRFRNDNGTRIPELLSALVEVAPEVLSRWTANAQHFHDVVIPTSHWLDDI